MTEVKNILLTFDYELFLGKRSGTFRNCLYLPTEELRRILGRNQAKAVFFIDVMGFREAEKYPELKQELNQVKRQIKELFEEGHFIFPHIHTHWLDSKYLPELKQFDLSNISRYSLLAFNSDAIVLFFSICIKYLQDLGIHYKTWGYRAGGWCIQPFERFRKAFLEMHIGYDFSVLPGYINESENQSFNFTAVMEKGPYFFSESIETPDPGGRLIEFPISCVLVDDFLWNMDRVVRKYLWYKGDRGFGDGISAQGSLLKSEHLFSEMVSIDILNISKERVYKAYLKDNSFMHWISHPKMFTRHGLKIFDRFLREAEKQFMIEYDFRNMRPRQEE